MQPSAFILVVCLFAVNFSAIKTQLYVYCWRPVLWKVQYILSTWRQCCMSEWCNVPQWRWQICLCLCSWLQWSVLLSHFLSWSPAIALAIAKTIIFYGCLKNFFSSPDYSTFLNRNFWNFATWHGSSFNRTFAMGLPLRCPLEQMRRQNRKFCRFSDQTATNIAPPFLSGEENQKSETVMSVSDYCRTWWHKFDGGRPTDNGDRRTSLHVGLEDFVTFGKCSIISLKRHKIGIQLLWTTYRKSRRSIALRHCRWPWVTPNPQMTYLCYIWPPFAFQARVKLDTANSVHLLIIANGWQPMTCCRQMGHGQGHVVPSDFGKTLVISRKPYKIATWLQRQTIRKSYVAYRMVILSMPLSDPYFCYIWAPFCISGACEERNFKIGIYIQGGPKMDCYLKVVNCRICWHRIALYIPNCSVFYPE